VVKAVDGYSGFKDCSESLLVKFDLQQISYPELLVEGTRLHKPQKKQFRIININRLFGVWMETNEKPPKKL
jgi:hypothetical protein